MALPLSVPHAANLDLFRPFHWVLAFIARRKARRIEAEAIQHLRQYDLHLLADLNLDKEALWQLHPSIRLLSSPELDATGAHAGNRAEDAMQDG